MHIATLVVTSLILRIRCFSLRQDLTNGSIADFNTNFADDAILSLAVARSINEKNSLHYCSVSFAHKSVRAILVITH